MEKMINVTNETFDNLQQNTSEVYPQMIQVVVVDFRQWFRYEYEVYLCGYFLPVWSIVNIFIYSIMIAVFIKTGMTSNTYACMMAIAVCDTLAPTCQSIMYFYFFGINKHLYFLPLEWCRIFHYMTEVLPNILVSQSNYLTLLLAVTRYIIVTYPFKAKELCSKRRIVYGMIICIIIPILLRAVQFIYYDYFGISVPAFDNKNKTMEACAVKSPGWIKIDFFKYLAITQAVYTFTFAIIPVIVHVIAESLLITALVRHGKRRQSLSLTNPMKDQREKRLTLATICIVAVNLSYGLCVVVVQTMDFLYLFFDIKAIENNDLRSVVTISNTIFWIVIPSNFIIACCLSEEFRKGFRSLFSFSFFPSTSTTSTTTDMNLDSPDRTRF